MASTFYRHVLFVFSLLLFFFTSSSLANASSRPRALVFAVKKDVSTLQYTTQIQQRTPRVPVKLTVDLGGEFLWVDCGGGYVSSSYRPALCRSAACNLARSQSCGDCFGPFGPGCSNYTCSLFPENSVSRTGTIGVLAKDVLSLQSTDGANPGRLVSAPQFLFTCGGSFLLDGLASGVKGMAGLGRSKIALPLQLAAAFSSRRKFGVCLSSSNGVVFFGDGPYIFPPGIDVSNLLSGHTPLILNPFSTAGSFFEGDPSTDYFIGVKSVKINGEPVPLNTTLLTINDQGNGGTKISTVRPYTVMETSIYKAFRGLFVKELAKAQRVAPVEPFDTCWNSESVGQSRVGPDAPPIDLVLESKKVWRMIGANSMVRVKENVLCLGFVDGGIEPQTSVVIGGHQIENNFLEFDLAASRLRFSSSLLFHPTTCDKFNFTSVHV